MTKRQKIKKLQYKNTKINVTQYKTIMLHNHNVKVLEKYDKVTVGISMPYFFRTRLYEVYIAKRQKLCIKLIVAAYRGQKFLTSEIHLTIYRYKIFVKMIFNFDRELLHSQTGKQGRLGPQVKTLNAASRCLYHCIIVPISLIREEIKKPKSNNKSNQKEEIFLFIAKTTLKFVIASSGFVMSVLHVKIFMKYF